MTSSAYSLTVESCPDSKSLGWNLYKLSVCEFATGTAEMVVNAAAPRARHLRETIVLWEFFFQY